MDLHELLREIYPISDEAIERMMPYVNLRKVSIRENIITQGEVTENIFLVKSGAFRNYSYHDNEETTRWFGIDGDVFTSMFSFSRGEPAMSTVVALLDSEVYEAPIDAVKKIITEDKEWAVWTAQYCLDGLYQLERRYTFLGWGDAYTRYRNLMKYKTFHLLNNVPLQVVASYLNVTPQTISRIRRRLASEK